MLVEDTAEIQLDKPNLVRLEARVEGPELPAVTIRDLVPVSLRLRPDRLLVGEVRRKEAFDLLQALNTGHEGSISTVHANSARLALSRLANCVLESGVELPLSAVRASIADSVNLVVHLACRASKQIVSEVVRIDGLDESSGRYELSTIRFPPESCSAWAGIPTRGRVRAGV